MQLKHYTTQSVAKLTGLSVATLRNYVYFSRLPDDVRTLTGVQHPPLAFPRVRRVRNRLQWDKASTDTWVKHRSAA